MVASQAKTMEMVGGFRCPNGNLNPNRARNRPRRGAFRLRL